MKELFLVFLISILFIPATLQAQTQTQFGDFSALSIDQEVVDHVFSEGNNIYVKPTKDYLNATFTVRISNSNRTDYRTWLNGESERQVSVYQTQQTDKQGYTYRINTVAKFVEYWVGDRLILHLKRNQ
jgi:hypothetical protein